MVLFTIVYMPFYMEVSTGAPQNHGIVLWSSRRTRCSSGWAPQGVFFLFFSIQHVLVSPIVYKWCYGMSIVYRHIIIIYGFNFTHPTVYPLQTPGNLDIIWLSFLYLFECPWLPQSAGCLFLSQDAQSALDQIASGVHVLRTRLTGCPQQATGLTAVRIYT